jgi:hypothetical protein
VQQKSKQHERMKKFFMCVGIKSNSSRLVKTDHSSSPPPNKENAAALLNAQSLSEVYRACATASAQPDL